MPTDHEIASRFARAFADKDFDTVMSLLHADVVFVEQGGLPYSGEWKGLDGIGALAQQILGAYDYEVQSLEVLDGGTRQIALVEVTFTSHRGGASVTTPIVEIYTVADGKIARDEIYYRHIPELAALAGAAAVAS